MKKISSWCAVVVWMALIFYLSHQPGGESSHLSGGVLTFIHALIPMFDLHENEWIHTFVRKGAHLGAYLILGALFMIALRSSYQTTLRKRAFIAFISSFLYAISDEVHQLFVSGRSGQVTDVLIDSLGAAIGIGIYLAISRFMSSRNRSTR